MKKYRIFIANKAEKDMIDTLNYVKYELKNNDAAVNLKNKLQMAILSLEEFPQRNKILNDNYLKKFDYRKILIDNYIIFYYISEKENTVYIVRILYNRRNWNKLLDN